MTELIVPPTPRWKPLDWDTAFFGFGIGEVDLGGCDPATLAAIDEEARAAGIRCLYGRLDPIEVETAMTVQEHGYRFVEAATMFDLHPSEPAIPKPEGVTVKVGTADDVERLSDMARTMADWSRYAADPRFGQDAARRMQLAWLERSARNEDGIHSLVIAERDGEAICFVGRVDGPQPRADGVGTTARGSGAARYLIQHIREWAGDRPLLGGPIAARNVAALRYVSHCAYRVTSVEYVYHRWLDE